MKNWSVRILIKKIAREYLRWRAAFKGQYHFVFKVLFLGIASGFPQILFFSLLPLWLAAAGLSLKAIAAFGAVGVFFAFNWVLAPLMDSISAFGLERRRFWLLITQGFMALCCLLLALLGIKTTGTGFLLMSLLILLIAFASAAQDVSIDALRIEITPKGRDDLLAFGSALGVIGWYTGFYLGGWFGLRLFSSIHSSQGALVRLQGLYGLSSQEITAANRGILDWQAVYSVLGCVIVLMMFLTLWVFRRHKPTELTPLPPGKEWLQAVLMRPFVSFIREKGWKLTLMLLAFLFLFKLGEAFLGRMSIIFYKRIGYTEAQIADYVKFFGWIFTVGFSFIGGLIAGRIGLWRGMMIGGIAMAATNLLYALIALTGPNIPLLVFTVLSDNFTTAFATVSTVAFISALCDRHYTASQYALFASVGTASRTLVASTAGWLLENVLDNHWAWFFVLTTVMVIPSLVLLWFMRKQSLFTSI